MLSIDISISTDLIGQFVAFLTLKRTFRVTFPGCAESDNDRMDEKVRLSAVER